MLQTYSLLQGRAPSFGVTNHTLITVGGSVRKCHEPTQVTAGKDNYKNPRSLKNDVQAYRVNENNYVAKGTAIANKKFGDG